MIRKEELESRGKQIMYPSLDKDITINMKDLYVLLHLMMENQIESSLKWWEVKGAVNINGEWNMIREESFSELTQLDYMKEAMNTMLDEGLLEFEKEILGIQK